MTLLRFRRNSQHSIRMHSKPNTRLCCRRSMHASKPRQLNNSSIMLSKCKLRNSKPHSTSRSSHKRQRYMGAYFPLCPMHSTEALTWHCQLKQPLCPSAFPSPHTRTHARLFLAASERICNTRTRAGRPASSASVSSHASSLPPRTPISSRAEALAAVLSTSTGPSGIDTFGNVGALRYGSTAFGNVARQRTGASSALFS
jgi:hypothetical protein